VRTLEELYPTDLVEHEILIEQLCKPVKRRQKRYTREEIEFSIVHFPRMVKAGIIEPGFGPWVSETLFLRKSNGKLRVVYDYRVVNAGTVDSGYPYHDIEQSLDILGMGRPIVYSKTDVSNGF
jgi:hypothetical protein